MREAHSLQSGSRLKGHRRGVSSGDSGSLSREQVVSLLTEHQGERARVILTTKRLQLREFEEGDWQALLEYQSNPQYIRYYHAKQRTEQEVRALVKMFIGWSKEQPRRKFQFAIVLRSEGRLIGNCSLRVDSFDGRLAEIGFELDSRYWSKGYATEATQALVALGFGKLGLHRIWAACIADNFTSALVLEQIGMRREGRLRENEWVEGRWWDTLLYGMLAREWRSKA